MGFFLQWMEVNSETHKGSKHCGKLTGKQDTVSQALSPGLRDYHRTDCRMLTGKYDIYITGPLSRAKGLS